MNIKRWLGVLLFVLAMVVPIYSQAAQEIQSIVEGAQSEDVSTVMKSIYFLEKIVDQVNQKHEKLWNEEIARIEKSYEPYFEALDEMQPEIWETDDEFELRREVERCIVEEKKLQAIEAAQYIALQNMKADREPYEHRIGEALEHLEISRTIPQEQIRVTPLEYQRNERIWPILIISNHDFVPFEFEPRFNFESLYPDDPENMKQAIINIDEAIGAHMLYVDVTWNMKKGERNQFTAGISRIDIINLLSNDSYYIQFDQLQFTSSYMVVGSDFESATIQRDEK